MGADIGYLQTKIRELQDKNEELTKKVEQSLQREKNIIEAIKQTSSDERNKSETFLKELIGSKIDLMYKEKFESIFNKHFEQMSEDTVLNAKGFNHSVDCVLKEIALLKKDNFGLVNLVIHKLKISQEEYMNWCKKFDKAYPSKYVEEDLKKFRMKFYTNRDDVKEIVGGEDDAP